jgi:hypothetical protein
MQCDGLSVHEIETLSKTAADSSTSASVSKEEERTMAATRTKLAHGTRIDDVCRRRVEQRYQGRGMLCQRERERERESGRIAGWMAGRKRLPLPSISA